jgi:hypothetical protein
MVSPLPALARAARSVPGPLSAVLVTVMFAAAVSVGANITSHPATTRLIDMNLGLVGWFLFLSFVFIVSFSVVVAVYCFHQCSASGAAERKSLLRRMFSFWSVIDWLMQTWVIAERAYRERKR